VLLRPGVTNQVISKLGAKLRVGHLRTTARSAIAAGAPYSLKEPTVSGL